MKANGTFSYIEYHWRCDPCGIVTLGLVEDEYMPRSDRPVTASNGAGWETRREARAAYVAHLKTHKEK